MIECRGVPAALLPSASATLSIDDAWFSIDDAGTVASIHTVRDCEDAGAVASSFAEV
jgi:hypothetical protein